MIWFNRIIPWRIKAVFSVVIFGLQFVLELAMTVVATDYARQILDLGDTTLQINSPGYYALILSGLFVARFFCSIGRELLAIKVQKDVHIALMSEFLETTAGTSPEKFYRTVEKGHLAHKVGVGLVAASASITLFFQIAFHASIVFGAGFVMFWLSNAFFLLTLGSIILVTVLLLQTVKAYMQKLNVEAVGAHQGLLELFNSSITDVYKLSIQSTFAELKLYVGERVKYFCEATFKVLALRIGQSTILEFAVVLALLLLVTIHGDGLREIAYLEVFIVAGVRALSSLRALSSQIPAFYSESIKCRHIFRQDTPVVEDERASTPIFRGLHISPATVQTLIAENEHVAWVIGESGSGKTSSLEHLISRDYFDKQRLVYIPQDPTVSFLQAFIIVKNLQRYQFFEFLAQSDLLSPDVLSSVVRDSRINVSHLSGGERKRLSLVMGFFLQPNYLILDEPFANLDAQNMDRCARYINDNCKQYSNIKVVICAHEQTF